LKIIVRCHQCDSNEEAALLEIGNENLHQVICDKGHRSSIIITQQKHEILFEVAAYAIVDGYYREAISSFAPSLERYYEFFIKVISVELPCKEFEKAWKQVAIQSERQLGGYIFLYLNVYLTSPNILPQPLVKLRNDVVHKGHIPSREDALKFGEAVAQIINEGCNLLHSTKSDNLMEIVRQTICPNNGANHAVLILSTYLNCLVKSKLTPLEEHLKTVLTHNQPRF